MRTLDKPGRQDLFREVNERIRETHISLGSMPELVIAPARRLAQGPKLTIAGLETLPEASTA